MCLGGGRSTEAEVHLRRSAAFKLFPSCHMGPLAERPASYCDGWGCCQQLSQKRSQKQQGSCLKIFAHIRLKYLLNSGLSQLVYRVFPDSLHSSRVSDIFQKVQLLGSSIIPWTRSLSSFWECIFWPTRVQECKSLPILCTDFRSAFIHSFSVNSVVTRPAENWKVTEHKRKEANYKRPGGSKVQVQRKGYGGMAGGSQG